MSRKKPNCAICGTPLVKARSSVIEVHEGVVGKPSFGWCGDCHGSEGDGWKFLPHWKRYLLIDARGPGRVLVTKGKMVEDAVRSSCEIEKRDKESTKCRWCDGSGIDPDLGTDHAPEHDCRKCSGTGLVHYDHP